ncbi:alpha/beta hydrolase [Robiginitalea sp. M366]|uniref:alpha/beta hydrolase n=1 Tax=Robiginitalea aestuariiviva TaxID=3036903 RepID=UPI00240E3804|nr:alpha/beta hydrolase [Robiginitalea aestuariiviva]MDG1573345.1 alpha/beta hydrolase [Robiginitalea aestuariiviva]
MGMVLLTMQGQTAPFKTIRLASAPATPEMVWEGGERTQISDWDGLPTVSNVSEPTLTVFLPEPSKATGTALVIAPGGGFHTLSIDNEGRDVARWCVEHGIAAFVLKYRLVPTGENPGREFAEKLQRSQEELDRQMSPYIALAKADGLAAIAYIREHAKSYGVKPDQIGIIGFSAGGTVAAAAALEFTSEANRPNFTAPIYPALHVLDYLHPPKEAIPAFFAVTEDDQFGFQVQTQQAFQAWNAARVASELHLYPKGGHGFGMRRQGLPSDAWITAFEAWLGYYGFLAPATR